MSSEARGSPENAAARPAASLRDLFATLRPYRRQLGFATLVSAGAIAAVVAVPLLVGKGVDEIQDNDKAGIVWVAGAIAAMGLLGAASQAARQLLAGRLGLQVEYDLRERYYSHLQALDLESLTARSTGQLVSRGTADLRPIRFFLGAGIPSLAQDAGSIVVAAVVMFTLDPDLAALTLSPLAMLVVATYAYNRAATARLKTVRERIGELARIAHENITAARLVRALVRERLEVERFRRSAGQTLAAALAATRVQARFTPTLAQIPVLGVLVVLLYGGHQAIDGEISVGELASFFTYAVLLLGPAATIAYWVNVIQQAIAATDRINEVLAQSPAIVSPSKGAPAPRSGDVSFRGVRAGHRGRTALAGVELAIPAGGTVAVVGGTGSGKSTLLALVNRLYEPDDGAIEVGGQSVAELDLTALRRRIAMAIDEDFLFSGSVRENIAYGHPAADDDAIRTAARRAQADGFIEALVDGYETEVGSRGITLSGGQRQRIALARALLAEPDILLLDNATASLDARTEAEELRELARHRGERTTILVAYRAPSLALADRVVVLDAGRVVAEGTHAELLARDARYRTLIAAVEPDPAGPPKERPR